MSYQDEFHDTIYEYLDMKGWTVEALAQRVGLSTSTLYKFIEGKRRGPRGRLREMCEPLELSDAETDKLTYLDKKRWEEREERLEWGERLGERRGKRDSTEGAYGLPDSSGDRFIGRYQEMEELVEKLNSPSPIVCLVGVAGVGKTALATEVGHRCRKTRAFKHMVYVTAESVGESMDDAGEWFGEMFGIVARHVNFSEFGKLYRKLPRYKMNRVYALLGTHKSLVIIDNFEKLDRPGLDTWLSGIRSPSKVLLISRHMPRVTIEAPHLVQTMRLDGLKRPEALALAKCYKPNDVDASREQLQAVVDAVQGHPCRIFLAIPLLADRDVKPAVELAATLDTRLGEEWSGLSEVGQELLMVSTFFAEKTTAGNATKQALAATLGLRLSKTVEAERLATALSEAKHCSLLTTDKDPLGQTRYVLPSVVRDYARAKLKDAPEFEVQARGCWSHYYLEYAREHGVPKALYAKMRRGPAGFCEDYWASATRIDNTELNVEWLNLRLVLQWAAENRQDRLLVDLFKSLVHYMDRRGWYSERNTYGRLAAEAANRLGQVVDEILFRIDSLGWLYITTEESDQAEKEIRRGIDLIDEAERQGQIREIEANALRALGHAFLAQTHRVEQRVEIASSSAGQAVALAEMILAGEIEPSIAVTLARVYVAAADVECAKANPDYTKAIADYRKAGGLGKPYDDREPGLAVVPMGFAHLRANNDVEARRAFAEVTAYEEEGVEQNTTIEMAKAKLGEAMLAARRGDRDWACQRALEARKFLTQQWPGHPMLLEIDEFHRAMGCPAE